MTPLRSPRYDLADIVAVNDLYHQRGWTDGLPILPPTEELVRACLDAAGLAPSAVIGVESVRQRPISAEKVAINAVMAGCRPAYMPVVVAVIKAICRPEFNLHGSTASTGGSAQFIVVNGPIRQQIGLNASHNVLANHSRANACIGRAIRLILINVLGCVPGQLDRSTLGHPGKFSFCIAEDEEDSPWTPLAQQRGIPAGTSAVTVMAGESPHQTMNEWTRAPEEIAETFAAEIRHNMLTYSIWAGNYALIVPKQLRDLIAAAGWQKRDIQEYGLPFRPGRAPRLGHGRKKTDRQPGQGSRPAFQRLTRPGRFAGDRRRWPGRRVWGDCTALAGFPVAGRDATD